MPLTNRVRPDGMIVAHPARGRWMGNRGVLHDDDGRLVRSWQVRRWLICRVAFRGRRRQVMTPGRYTELFFLDEATALAAGHRPCAECRRGDWMVYRDAFAAVHPGLSANADAVDRVLHEERTGLPVVRDGLAGLPDGVLVDPGDGPRLVAAGRLHRWHPDGYGPAEPVGSGPMRVLTPATTVAVLARGYRPDLAPS